MAHGVLLLDPKYPHNVGGVLRACACFGARAMRWNGDRVPGPDDWPAGSRLPREERLRYRDWVDFGHLPFDDEKAVQAARLAFGLLGPTPVAVERTSNAERLFDFVHPEHALYVFGPEDGGVSGAAREECHRFVSVPTHNDGPLNLAAAVNVVLYDRHLKQDAGWREFAMVRQTAWDDDEEVPF